MTKKQPLICIKCDFAEFIAPENEIYMYTGGLYCKKSDIIVGKYEECRVKDLPKKGKAAAKTAENKK